MKHLKHIAVFCLILTMVSGCKKDKTEKKDDKKPASTISTEKTFNVSATDATKYVVREGSGASQDNPDLTLIRGKKYEFVINAPGHPFLIKTSQGTGTSGKYDNGVTNNGTASGTITFIVPSDAPNTLYYNCQYHPLQKGTINITN